MPPRTVVAEIDLLRRLYAHDVRKILISFGTLRE